MPANVLDRLRVVRDDSASIRAERLLLHMANGRELDEPTVRHSVRTAVSMVALSAEGLALDHQTVAYVGALLHDNGKSSCLDIIRKPTVFTPNDRRVVERHPHTGHHRMTARFPFPHGPTWRRASTLVLMHHSSHLDSALNYPPDDILDIYITAGETSHEEIQELRPLITSLSYVDCIDALTHPQERLYTEERLTLEGIKTALTIPEAHQVMAGRLLPAPFDIAGVLLGQQDAIAEGTELVMSAVYPA